VLVAEQDGALVGYIWFVWYEHIKEKGVAYLEELYVVDKLRASGIGKALVSRATELIKKAGIRTVYVAVGNHMKDAQSFYEHVGFMPSREMWFSKEL
jgi:GNAT superfamily N-acetyltransferase